MAEQKQAVKKRFMKDTISEMKKVVWPTRTQVAKSTLVVIGVIAVITILIFAFDTVLGGLTALVTKQ